MNCIQARELWESEPLEAIDAARRSSLDHHADECDDCAGEIALLEAVVTELPLAARPYTPRKRWPLQLASGVAAAALLAALIGFLLVPVAQPVSDPLPAHVIAARTFVRELENLRGEDPGRDLRLVAAEWQISGLKDATAALDAAEAGRRYGPSAARYVEAFQQVAGLIETGASVRDIQRVVQPGHVEAMAARVSPAATPSVKAVETAGRDEVSRFLTARSHLYAGDMKEAETLFGLFCSDFPGSPYRSDAAYWGLECARGERDMKAIVQFLGQIGEEEWMDSGVIGDVTFVMGQPGVEIVEEIEGLDLMTIIDELPAGQVVFMAPPLLLKKAAELKRSPAPSPKDR